MKNFRFQLIFSGIVLLLVLAAQPLAAQGDGIKKSKKTEIIDGKKYYLHTVEKGQTLFGIARAYGLSVNDVQVENPDALNGIKPGMVLKIPAQKPLPPVNTTPKPQTTTVAKDTSTFLYTAQPGQTLYSIAQQNNTTVERLQELNPELKISGLRAGQQIKVPGKPKPGTEASLPANALLPDTTIFVENKKTLYNVVLMLPLQLERAEGIEPEDDNKGAGFSEKAEVAIQFYEGALLAVDSMRKKGMKVKLYVFDIGKNDSINVEKVLLKPELQQADLIIGPLDPEPFYKVAEFARKKKIAVVSPVAASNRVLFKQASASKTTPSQTSVMEQLAMNIGTTATTENIILINSGSPKDQQLVKTFRGTINALRIAAGKDTITIINGTSGLDAALKKDKKNIIVAPTSSQTFVTGLLLTLSGLSDRYSLEVYGMPVWMTYDNLDKAYMQKVNLHYAAPYFIDYDDPATKRLQLKYRAAFKGDAGTYVFAGFDVTLFYLNAMFSNGTLFYLKLNEMKADGLQQRFEFYRPEEESGYENRAIRIVRMEDYKLVRKS
ncbi:MAG: PBP1 and LysM peptidoglycan-binding domain-containing protein [Bacteroidia bacterium]